MLKRNVLSRLLVKIASELGYVEVMPGVQRTNEAKESWVAKYPEHAQDKRYNALLDSLVKENMQDAPEDSVLRRHYAQIMRVKLSKEADKRYTDLRSLRSHSDVAEYINGGKEHKDPRTLTSTLVKSTRFQGLTCKNRADSLTAWAAIKEWNKIQDWLEAGNALVDFESDYIYRLDANAQGIQIMAALVGNLQTAMAVNILYVEGNPSDPYGLIGKESCKTLSGIAEMKRMHDLIKAGGRDLSKGPLMTAAYGAGDKTITYGEKGLKNAILKLNNGEFKDCNPETLCELFRTEMNNLFPALKQFTDLIQEAIDARLTNQFGPANPFTGQRPGRGDIMNLMDGGRQRWVKPVKEHGGWVYTWSEGLGKEKRTYRMDLVITEQDGIPCWMDINSGKFYQKEFTHEDLVVRWMTPNGAQWEHSYYLEEQDIIRCKEGVTAEGKKSELTCRKVPGKETLDVMQMMSAMSPNIIHSLDACMLSMVTNEMAKHGAQMVAVHDEYGTHLADANLMESLIPKMFVKMLEGDVLQDILDDIHLEWVAPPHGIVRQFDISECLDANYMFS